MASNYFKILGKVPIEFVFFDDSSLSDTQRAWEQASMLRGFSGNRKIVAGSKIALSGPWSEIPVTYVSGLAREYR